MLFYATVGAHDIAQSAIFYDAALSTLGWERLREVNDEIGYGPKGDRPRIWLLKPFNGLPASFGNGILICLYARSRAEVDKFYAAAIASGGQDEGKPGLRSVDSGYLPNWYACYVRDPTGNKLSAVYDQPI